MAACFGLAPVARAETVTLLGGPVGGVWYIVAAGMAKIIHDSYPDILVRVEPGGAVTNPAQSQPRHRGFRARHLDTDGYGAARHRRVP